MALHLSNTATRDPVAPQVLQDNPSDANTRSMAIESSETRPNNLPPERPMAAAQFAEAPTKGQRGIPFEQEIQSRADISASPHVEFARHPSLHSDKPTGPEPQKPALVTRWVDRFVLLPNLQNPKSYKKHQKAFIVFLVSLASLCAPFASNILMPTFPFIGPPLRLTSTEVTLTTTVFMIAIGVGPLFHAFLSEQYGRRPVYLAGFALFTIASIACTSAPDGDDLIAYRFFQAFGSSAAQSVGIGTIADIYIPAERGRATGWWFLGLILGPMISPVVGGALFEWMGWRAVLGATSIFGLSLLILMVLFLPETSVSLKARQAAALSSPPIPAPSTTSVRSRSTSTLVKAGILFTLKQTLKHTIQPLAAILYLLFPPIGLTALYSSICFASLYGISTTTPFSFSEPPYKFDSLTISLLYLPSCVGYMLGSVCGGYLSDRELRHAKARYGDNYPPEARLRSARWGVPLIPAGLLMFGWGVSRWDHVAVPLIGGFIFGVGLMLTNGTIMAFFADVIPGQTASVVAAFNLMRNLLAGLVAAVTIPAIKSGLQEGWFLTILAVLCTISSLSLETVQRLGPYWRQRREERVQNARSEAAAERSMRGSIRPATSVSSPSRAHSVRSVTSERPIPLYTLPSSPISPDPQGSSLSQVPIKDDIHNVKS